MAKLDKIEFAQLIAFICDMVRRGNVDYSDIVILDDMINIAVPQQVVYPHNDDIERLMFLMLEGKQKIEAIKIHRKITGIGLKESKDAVERHWPDGDKKYNIAELRSKLNTDVWSAVEYSIIEKFLREL